jgi:hypothetical protein
VLLSIHAESFQILSRHLSLTFEISQGDPLGKALTPGLFRPLHSHQPKVC